MSDCDVCLDYDLGGSIEFYSERQRKARKPHRCYECVREIQAGTEYIHVVGKQDGQIWNADICLSCYNINTVFACDGPIEWGNMWEAVEEYVFPRLTVGSACFTKLTDEARAFLIEKWWQWKERDTA